MGMRTGTVATLVLLILGAVLCVPTGRAQQSAPDYNKRELLNLLDQQREQESVALAELEETDQKLRAAEERISDLESQLARLNSKSTHLLGANASRSIAMGAHDSALNAGGTAISAHAVAGTMVMTGAAPSYASAPIVIGNSGASAALGIVPGTALGDPSLTKLVSDTGHDAKAENMVGSKPIDRGSAAFTSRSATSVRSASTSKAKLTRLTSVGNTQGQDASNVQQPKQPSSSQGDPPDTLGEEGHEPVLLPRAARESLKNSKMEIKGSQSEQNDAKRDPATQLRYWTSIEIVLSLTLVVLAIFMISAVIYLARKATVQWSPQSVMRLFGLGLIIPLAIMLVVAGYSETQMSSAMGLLGVIAGYLLGNGERRGEPEAKPA
ncbi:hypothetical protein [Lysobacter enzymogenes]|uniref:hypothetical protein n=1 Tax=Lysobacter enzymogenes TaxID=69 RepID=UPI001AF12BAE|nr:hypothetical protein [Lysobacter enzymogenes]QQQ02905.1 hypothetical protein JHW41_08075 [Lysobacter enzymogenes]